MRQFLAPILIGLGVLVLGAPGCSDDEHPDGIPQGSERGVCYPNGTCNTGLVCLSNICVRPNSDAAVDAGPEADAGPDTGVADTGSVDLGTGDGGADGSTDVVTSDDAEVGDGAVVDADPSDVDPSDVDPSDVDPSDVDPSDVGPDGGPLDGSADAGDATPADTGADAGDTGPLDSGVPPPCDPLINTGCNFAEVCHWIPAGDTAACHLAPQMIPFEAPCNLAMDQCAPGLSCLFLPGDQFPNCHRVCDLPGGTECVGLSGMSPSYTCQSVLGSTDYGACLPPTNLCQPLTPMCPPNQVCSFLMGQTTCEPAGPANLGQACDIATNNCAVGQGMCFDSGGGNGFCRQVCDPMSPACGAGATCVSAGADYGVCIPADCTPFDGACGPTEICSAINNAVECRPVGTGLVGQACTLANDCAAGGFCLSLGPSGQCFEPCDANNPCSMGSCLVSPALGFGVCF